MKNKTNRFIEYLLMCVGCLTAAAAGGVLFYRNVNRVFVKNAPAIGRVTYKHNMVQRRFSTRLIWGQLANGTPVYSGDLVRTAALSGAEATFEDGDSVSLQDDSLIQIFYDENEGARIALNTGALSTNSVSGRMRIQAKGTELRLEKGGAAEISSLNGAVEARAVAGDVRVKSGGEEQTLGAGSVLTSGADGSIRTAKTLAVERPLPGEVIVSPQLPAPVRFSWDLSGLAPESLVRVEFSRAASFRTIDHTEEARGTGGLSVLLETGEWWWRAFRPEYETAAQGKTGGRLVIRYEAPPADPSAPPPAALAALSKTAAGGPDAPSFDGIIAGGGRMNLPVRASFNRVPASESAARI